MARIRWDDSMRFGVAELDELHQDLTTVIADLGEALLRNAHEELLKDMAEELYDLAQHVFGVEEDRMAERGVEQAAAHKAEHTAFLRTYAAPLLDFADGEADLDSDHLDGLARTWLAHLDGPHLALGLALAGAPGV